MKVVKIMSCTVNYIFLSHATIGSYFQSDMLVTEYFDLHNKPITTHLKKKKALPKFIG